MTRPRDMETEMAAAAIDRVCMNENDASWRRKHLRDMGYKNVRKARRTVSAHGVSVPIWVVTYDDTPDEWKVSLTVTTT